jgi:thiamine-monophosphate kinase
MQGKEDDSFPRSASVRDLGERAIIEAVRSRSTSKTHSDIIQGIDDDCAVLRLSPSEDLLVTTDTMVEETHFTARTLPPEVLGWKVLATNMSDIAAMGGTPKTAFLSLALKRDVRTDFLDSFLKGFNDLAQREDIVLAGGDTVEAPYGHVITLTLLGECLPDGAVYRHGAQPGDDVWVTGCLGNAAGGLFLLTKDLSAEWDAGQTLTAAHQRPNPRVDLGKRLAQSGLIHAMIDLSDGISRDLTHVCRQSGQGATLDQSAIPISEDLRQLGKMTGQDPYHWALHGGEDYELLFTAPRQNRKAIESLGRLGGDPPLYRVGKIIRGSGISLLTNGGIRELTPRGFAHFAKPGGAPGDLT